MSSDIEKIGDSELYFMLDKDKATAEKAFAELYARYSSRVYAYCRRFLGNKDDARDIFQETFVRFFQSVNEDRVMTNVPAFLLKIARNLCVNFKRKNKETVSFEEYMYVNQNKNDQDELLKLIKMALDFLPDEYKDLFILREYEGFSYNEISELTGLSLSTVKIRLFRAKQKIREILQPYLADL